MTAPWHDYDPAFLAPQRAYALLAWLNKRHEWKQEDGYCPKAEQAMKPQHDALQWGPRQAYNACVPPEFKIQSSGPIPHKLSKLHDEIAQRYRATFNSIQVNRHWNADSIVHPHSDLMHGHIVMLSLGAPRRFVLKYKKDDKAKTLNRWKAGDVYFDEVLPHGSLLTIFKQHQMDMTHEMPKADAPCGPRISMIWRFISTAVTQKLHSTSLWDTSEYDAAQAKWKGEQA
jgi:alkylated DNA repair dioxygenase AlkB